MSRRFVNVKGAHLTQVKAGRPARKVPLPALPAGARGLTGPIPLTEQEAATHARVRDALQQTRESQPNLSVPDELVDPHALVRATAARLKRRVGNEEVVLVDAIEAL